MTGINSSTNYTCAGIAVPNFAEESDRFLLDSTVISLLCQFSVQAEFMLACVNN